MHACARALHDAVKASTPVERNFLQLGPGPFLGWGRRFCPWYCYRKTKKTKQKKTKKKYCTVEIPTEMEFTGTFQKYLQCVNRMSEKLRKSGGFGNSQPAGTENDLRRRMSI